VTPPTPNILVVSAVPDLRERHRDWLTGAGHQVTEAPSAAGAFALLGRSKVDLVLLDVDLPDRPGLDVCDQIKHNRATSSIPVLLMSAVAEGPDDRSNALNRGADSYLIEPVERDELLATATSLLRYHEARRTAERLAIRLERLHQATLLMSAAPSVADLLQFACTGLASVFGTSAAVLVTRDDIGRVAIARPNEIDPTMHIRPVPEVLAAAEAAAFGSIPDLSAVTPVPELAGAAIGSQIATPRGELVGAVLLLTPHSPPEDELMLDHFAQALAVALENQRLYAVEHQIALTLQRAMLPASIPQSDHVELAVRYLAASDTAEIGGDFYEALRLSDDVTLVAVGDVVGHSLQAATVMAELRHTLRAFASVGMPIAQIIERLGRMLAETHPGVTATVCIAEIDRAGELRIANAGHVPPVVHDGREVTVVEGHGPLLGLRSTRAIPTVTVPFGPGSTLVLVTDGLVERRLEDLDVGLDRLQQAVATHSGDAETLCEAILTDVGAGSDTFDDIAIVVARAR
jgi:CheY-like chemotaxis protein